MALSKTKVRYSLNLPKMKEKKASPGLREGAEERDRARRASGPGQPNREERLAKRRVRDRARRGAQTVEQRQALSARQTR